MQPAYYIIMKRIGEMFFFFRQQGNGNQPAGVKEKLQEISRRLAETERNLEEIYHLFNEQSWTIEKVVIEKMIVEKFAINLEKIDVGELSGMLNIGQTFGGKIVQAAEKKGVRKSGDPRRTKGQDKKPDNAQRSRKREGGPLPNIKVTFGNPPPESP